MDAAGAPKEAAAAGKSTAAGKGQKDVDFVVWSFRTPPLEDAQSVRTLHRTVVAPAVARMIATPPQGADSAELECAIAIAENSSPPQQGADSGGASAMVPTHSALLGTQVLRIVLCFAGKGRMKQSISRTLGKLMKVVENVVQREAILVALAATLEPMSWLQVSHVLSRGNLAQRGSSTRLFFEVSWGRSRQASAENNLVAYLHERLVAGAAANTELAMFQAVLGMDSLAPPPRQEGGSKRPLITFMSDAVPVKKQQPPSSSAEPAPPSSSAAATAEPTSSSAPAPAEPSTSAGAPPAPPAQPAAPNSTHLCSLQRILEWDGERSATAVASSAAAIMSVVANLALEHADALATLELLQQQEAARMQVRCPAELLRPDLILASQVLSMV